mmetsp:Transcript_11130/g.36622  ORF Transcript_11130/g.36622 Transcript_11130/m.36622 type:complete len:455 (+) Transcript_11130:198-1562(+)
MASPTRSSPGSASEAAAMMAADAASSGGGGGDDGFVSLLPDEVEEPKPVAKASASAAKAEVLAQYARSELEEVERKAHFLRLRHEKQKLSDRVNEMMQTFNDSLRDLRRDKFKLEADLKAADMKRLVLYQELVLLKEFEKQEVTLTTKLDNKTGEKNEQLTKKADINSKVESKHEELENMQDKRAHIVREFDSLVEEGNSFRDALLKVFTRKIKRLKKKTKENADEDYDSEEEDEDDEDALVRMLLGRSSSGDAGGSGVLDAAGGGGAESAERAAEAKRAKERERKARQKARKREEAREAALRALREATQSGDVEALAEAMEAARLWCSGAPTAAGADEGAALLAEAERRRAELVRAMESEVEAAQRKLAALRTSFSHATAPAEEAAAAAAANARQSSAGDSDEARECRICMSAENTHACVPCGHKLVCEACSQTLSLCPFCRAPVQGFLRIFD